ncbi:hypothetical protein J6590_076568 [Homalodisca vitripennis]|nr:hypothetical protein J6590_076568 [Homalodisca vitripennis]
MEQTTERSQSTVPRETVCQGLFALSVTAVFALDFLMIKSLDSEDEKCQLQKTSPPLRILYSGEQLVSEGWTERVVGREIEKQSGILKKVYFLFNSSKAHSNYCNVADFIRGLREERCQYKCVYLGRKIVTLNLDFYLYAVLYLTRSGADTHCTQLLTLMMLKRLSLNTFPLRSFNYM